MSETALRGHEQCCEQSPVYAHVVVDVPVSSSQGHFDYVVPPELAAEVAVGSPVIVPFGPRRVQGFVVGISDRSEAGSFHDLKPIQAVAPGAVKVPPDLVELARWMSRRYLCLMVDAIKAMAPSWQASQARRARLAVYTLPDGADPEELLRQSPGLSAARARLIRALATAGQLPLAELAREASCSPSTVRAAERDGLIVKEYVTPPSGAGSSVPEGSLYGIGRGLGGRGLGDRVSLTPAQADALRAVEAAMDSGGGVVLLHGVTGSGKTEIYLRALERAAAQGKQGIFLVPDIALTPQMLAAVSRRFGRRVAVLHSALAGGQRMDQWERALRGEVDVVVGARSAVFAPLPNLGLIVVDEEHDSSYKQDENPRYSARDVAIERGRITGATVVLGSATPSLESYSRAAGGAYRLVQLPYRVNRRPLPPVRVVDMRAELKSGNRSVLSRLLKARIEEGLTNGKQALLLMNRRGFSTFVLCRDCGYVSACPSCDVSLTYHARARAGQEMMCHHCGHVEPVPRVCPECGGERIKFFGVGTERVEEEVRAAFPGASTARMDVDTTRRRGAHAEILGAFRDGRTDILIGTQMIAKGLDFPNVTTVGVISADTSMNLPDFRAAERTFQLISQVAGRAGRGPDPGCVVVQTYNPEHYSVV
ncbi:MAG: primosomal protein N', partial [Bacillota bacterium]